MSRIITESQGRAIRTRAPLTVTLAGPGSGKSTVLVARIHALIGEGVDPAGIVAISFTNHAAGVLRKRLGEAVKIGYVGTLHAYALRSLRLYGGFMGYGDRAAVIDETAALDLLASQMKAQNCKASMTKMLELKREGRPARRNADGSVRRLTVEETTIAKYYDDLSESGLLDLEGILPEFARLLNLRAGPSDPIDPLECRADFSDLLVDESQDSSAQDWAVYNALPAARKFFVGDPDQAVYSFRGGRQDLFLNLAKRETTELITLEENFRCCPKVCSAANMLIAHNKERVDKKTHPANIYQNGYANRLTPAMTEGGEAAAIAHTIRELHELGTKYAEIAVLCRSNAIAASLREEIKACTIPVDEPPRVELPPDWSLAQSLVELLAHPENDRLAFFYVLAREVRDGATQKDAREKAHTVKLEAAKARRSINSLWFNLPKDPNVGFVVELLAKERITKETQARVVELWGQLPAGADSCAELALEMGRSYGESNPAERVATGVTVATIHAAKGREWDAVILAGFEDETIPGTSIKPEVIEEERRLAFVGITRARMFLLFSSSETRRATWGRQEILQRRPSRFIAEALT